MPVVYFRKEATPTPEQRTWRARIAANEKPLIAAFLAWVDRLHEQLTDSVLANAIIHRSAGMLDHILQAVAFQPVLLPTAVDEAVRSFDDVARRLDPQLHLSFNLHNPHFDRMVQAEQARLVREVSTETRRAIANVVSRGYASGIHPYDLAPQIRQTVGLTSRQANAVMNFAEGQRKLGRSPDQVAGSAMRYAGKMRTARAKLIATTETSKAATSGRVAGFLDAGAQGLFNTSTAMIEWSSVQDDPEEICAQLNGTQVPLGEDFDGEMPGYIHPGCRCSVFLVTDGSGGSSDSGSGGSGDGSGSSSDSGPPPGDNVSVGPAPYVSPAALAKIDELGLAGDVKMGPAARALYGNGKSTEDLFKVNGEWTAERTALHKQIIESHFVGKQTFPAEHKSGYFTSGGGASGKSAATFDVGGKPMTMEQIAARPDTVAIDPDRIKLMLPEYKALRNAGDPYAAAGVHEESSALAKSITAEANKRGLSTLVDTTGSSSKFASKLEVAAKQGYDVQVQMFSTPTNEAIMRSVARGKRSGRYVSIDPLKNAHTGASRQMALWKDNPSVAAWKIYDNSGVAPELIARGGGGGAAVIYDSRKFAAIVAKANEGGK